MGDDDQEQLDMSLEALMRQGNGKKSTNTAPEGGGPSTDSRSPSRGRSVGGRRGSAFRRGSQEGNWNQGWHQPRRGGWRDHGFGREDSVRSFWRGGFRGAQNRGGAYKARAGGGQGSGWAARGPGGDARREFPSEAQPRGDHSSTRLSNANGEHRGFDPKNYDGCTVEMESGDVVVEMHGTKILKIRPHGDIVLDSGNHRPRSMLKAFNDVLNLVSVQVIAADNSPEDWSVKDGQTLMRFFDGLVLKAKGPIHQTRGQTILQAFSHPNRKAAVEATMASTRMAQSFGLLPNADPRGKGPGPLTHGQSNHSQVQEVKDPWNEWMPPDTGRFHHHHDRDRIFPARDDVHSAGFCPDPMEYQHPGEFGPSPPDPWHMHSWGGKIGGPDADFPNGIEESHYQGWNGYIHPPFDQAYGLEHENRPYSFDPKIRRKIRQGRYQPY